MHITKLHKHNIHLLYTMHWFEDTSMLHEVYLNIIKFITIIKILKPKYVLSIEVVTSAFDVLLL